MNLLPLVVSIGAVGAIVLTPESDPVRLVAHADALTHRVRLEQLSAGVTYEVRVSYVATTPCSFSIRLADERVSTGRHLLNAEKLLFRLEHGGDHADVDIVADLNDIWPINDRRQVPFIVSLESTLQGVPHSSSRIILFVLFCVVFVISIFVRN